MSTAPQRQAITLRILTALCIFFFPIISQSAQLPTHKPVFTPEIEEYINLAAVEASTEGSTFGEVSGFYVVAEKRSNESGCYIDIAIYSRNKNLVDRRFDICHKVLTMH